MKTSMKIPAALFERLLRRAEQEEVRPSQLADHAIRSYLESYPFEGEEPLDNEVSEEGDECDSPDQEDSDVEN
jgi:hypothetical protein